MGVIIYYDANRTVRQLVSQSFRARGLCVVELEAIDDFIAALDDNAGNVDAAILDLSRHPDRLPMFQRDIPTRFHRPERCVLTIGRADDLTPYLPESADACFFKHVIERPFKKVEFVDFITSLVRGGLGGESVTNVKKVLADRRPIRATCDSPGASADASDGESRQVDEQAVRDMSNDVTNMKKIDAIRTNGDREDDASNDAGNDISRDITHMKKISADNREDSDSNAAPHFDAKATDSSDETGSEISTTDGKSSELTAGANVTPSPEPGVDSRSSDGATTCPASSDREIPPSNDAAVLSQSAALPPAPDDLPALVTAPDNATVPKTKQFHVLPSNPANRKENRMSRIGRTRTEQSHSRIRARDAYRAVLPEFEHATNATQDAPPPSESKVADSSIQAPPSAAPALDTPATRETAPAPHDATIVGDTPSSQHDAPASPADAPQTVPSQDQNATHGDATQAPQSPRSICPLPPPFRQGKIVDPLAAALSTSIPDSGDISSPGDELAQPDIADPAAPSKQLLKLVPRRPAFLAAHAPSAPPLPTFRSAAPQFPTTPEPTSSHNLTLPSSCNEIALGVRTSFQTLWFVRLLSESILTKSRFTLVGDGGQSRHVLFVESGRAFWFETFTNGRVPSINEYLTSISDATIPVESIKNHVRANRCALSQAFKSLQLEDVAANLCRSRIRLGIDGIFSQWSSLNFEVYEGIPEPYAAVIRMRPCKFIQLPQIVFEKLRNREAIVTPPKSFSDVQFVMRAFRSPLNARIQLTPEELEFLATIQTPQTLQQIKRLGRKHVRETLYRLWLFQFIDLCA